MRHSLESGRCNLPALRQPQISLHLACVLASMLYSSWKSAIRAALRRAGRGTDSASSDTLLRSLALISASTITAGARSDALLQAKCSLIWDLAEAAHVVPTRIPSAICPAVSDQVCHPSRALEQRLAGSQIDSSDWARWRSSPVTCMRHRGDSKDPTLDPVIGRIESCLVLQ